MTSNGAFHAKIGRGMLVLLGIAVGDTPREAEILCDRIIKLRIFRDEADKMNLPIGKMNTGSDNTAGDILIVPNFTLYADCKKSRRPDFFGAARPEAAKPLFDYFTFCLGDYAKSFAFREGGGTARVLTGVFGADMKITLTNDGPVTIILDTEELC
ncbi:D-aminoacyl-tRNA deacylase [bioreactor metagenome]|uniref:D-aminoacyl-tRNA deacylase n=1 Tax=bioreactor metagenome TaxID=1076179 RepID=A0A645BR19_9ZZZZ